MAEKKISFTYQEFDSPQIFEADIQELLQEVIRFSANAYAPYSNFHVSAVLQLEDGTILKGANMENASYPVSICAERNLLSTAVSNYPNLKIKNLAIYVDQNTTTPVPPCGLCRQTLLEVEQRQETDIRLYLLAKNGKVIVIDRCADLLPLYFDGEFLKS
ncbi:MAG: cytidine deaminase [Flavobacteriales bacterium]|nr:cytidine deaminase [Flavobacteriales bacterium]